MKLFKELFQRRELILNLVIRNLKIRYKGSIMGFFWSFLDPLLMMCVYYVFIRFMRFSIDLPVLLTGVLVWQFFVLSVNDSAGVITGSTNLVKKTYFPRIILPLSTVIANLVNFLLSLIVLTFVLLILKTKLSCALIYLPFAVIMQFTLCLGMSLIVSCANVFFKDTEHLLGVMLMTWFFMTPIIYPVSKVPERFINYYFLNPMAFLVTLYRHVFLGLWMPGHSVIFISLISVTGICIAGVLIFSHYQKYFADEL